VTPDLDQRGEPPCPPGVLVVEDEEAVRGLPGMGLRLGGFRVGLAGGGREVSPAPAAASRPGTPARTATRTS